MCHGNLLGSGRFSTCANMLWRLQDRVVQDMELARHGFRYQRVDPIALHLYNDGSLLRTWRDPHRPATEVARLDVEVALALAGWNNDRERVARLMAPFVFREPTSSAEILEHAGSTLSNTGAASGL